MDIHNDTSKGEKLPDLRLDHSLLLTSVFVPIGIGIPAIDIENFATCIYAEIHITAL